MSLSQAEVDEEFQWCIRRLVLRHPHYDVRDMILDSLERLVRGVERMTISDILSLAAEEQRREGSSNNLVVYRRL